MANFDLDAEMMENLMAADDKIQKMFEGSNTPKLRTLVKDAFHQNAVKKNHKQNKQAQSKDVVNER